MSARTGDYPIGFKPSPFWWWLLLALLLHALFFMGWHRILWKAADLQVASGDNARELELEEAVVPVSLAEPPPILAPTTVPTAPQKIEPVIPKPDDFIIPKSAPAPPTTSSGLKQPRKQTVTLPPCSTPHQTHSKIHSTPHHDTIAGERIGGAGNEKASYLANPEPPYPEAVRDAQIEGTVELMVNVSEIGNVTAVRLVRTSGNSDLDQSALHTVRTLWKFHPCTSAGIPVSSGVLVPISFRLSE